MDILEKIKNVKFEKNENGVIEIPSDLKLSKRDFFQWANLRKLSTPEDIAPYIRRTSQTVRNWGKQSKSSNIKESTLELWAIYTLVYYEDLFETTGFVSPSDLEEPTFAALKKWQNKNGFSTYQHTGTAFGIERQAVHMWFKRQSIPSWVPLGCAGYDILRNKSTF